MELKNMEPNYMKLSELKVCNIDIKSIERIINEITPEIESLSAEFDLKVNEVCNCFLEVSQPLEGIEIFVDPRTYVKLKDELLFNSCKIEGIKSLFSVSGAFYYASTAIINGKLERVSIYEETIVNNKTSQVFINTKVVPFKDSFIEIMSALKLFSPDGIAKIMSLVMGEPKNV